MTQNLREVSTVSLSNTANPPMSAPMWGYLFGLFGTIFFSMKAIFIKLAYQPMDGLPENAIDAITLMTLRLGFSAPVYIGILWVLIRRVRKRGDDLPPLRDFLLAASLGVLGYYICAWLDIQGLKYVTAQLERLLLFTYPIFVFVLGAIFFGKPLSRWAIVAIIFAYAGIGIIFSGGDIAVGLNVPLGAAMILGCAFAFAIFQLLAKPMIGRLGSLMFTCSAMLGAGFIIFTHFIIENTGQGTLITVWDMPPRIYILGVALAFISTLLPSFLVNIAIGRIGPQATSALGMVSPIATIILAIVLLGEPFGLVDAAGTLLTLIGIGLYTWFDMKSSKANPIKLSRDRGK